MSFGSSVETFVPLIYSINDHALLQAMHQTYYTLLQFIIMSFS